MYNHYQGLHQSLDQLKKVPLTLAFSYNLNLQEENISPD